MLKIIVTIIQVRRRLFGFVVLENMAILTIGFAD